VRLLLPPSRTVRGPADAFVPLDRYTGVLYKALGVEGLTPEQRRYAEDSILIHTAEDGLRGADGSVPPPLDELVAVDEAVVDLRSKEYAKRDPLPEGGWTVRVVTSGEDGRRLAISHWNKHFKGVFVGALIADSPSIRTIEDLLRWAAANDHALEPVAEGHLDLLV